MTDIYVEQESPRLTHVSWNVKLISVWHFLFYLPFIFNLKFSMYYFFTIMLLIEVVLVLVPALVGIAYVTIAERKIIVSMPMLATKLGKIADMLNSKADISTTKRSYSTSARTPELLKDEEAAKIDLDNVNLELAPKMQSFLEQVYEGMHGTGKVIDNPFALVTEFLKNYPTIETSKDKITFELLVSILSNHAKDFNITEAEFILLKDIAPKRFTLPLSEEDYTEFINAVGRYAGKGGEDKAGVYIFTDKIDGYSYVGSSIRLGKRLMHAYLGNRIGKRKIELALKELKLESFYLDLYILPVNLIKDKNSTEIKNFTLFLEQYYMLMLNPKYNVLKVAGSSAGRVVSEETKNKLSLIGRNRIGENNPMFNLKHSKETRALIAAMKVGQSLSEETKAKISTLLSGENHPMYGKERSEESKIKNMLSQKNRSELEVFDAETNSWANYPSIRAAAKELGISPSTINGYLRYTPLNGEKKLSKGRYIFKLVTPPMQSSVFPFFDIVIKLVKLAIVLLGKGALKIPSKQYTYTIKTQPLIHISYIKAKSAQITKPNPFIVSSPLQSSIFPFTLSIKNFIKYLSFTNIIIGLISLTVIGLVKILHIPTYILGIFNLESLELLEYIIAGFFGLVSRLSLKGIVEGIFVDNYATMGGENPTQGGNSSLGSKGAGVSGTNTLNSDLAEKGKQGGSNPSGGNKPLESESSPEGASNTQTQSGGDSSPGVDTQKEGAGQSSSTYSPVAQFMAKRYTKIYDGLVNNLVEEVKRLTLEMDKAKDDQQKWDDLSSKREENFQQIQMVTEASAEEMKKYIPRDTSSTAAKRDLGDAALDKKEGEPSKKK
jgi:group I intron endonuclease